MTHKEFLELAAAAIDFPQSAADRRRMDEHLAGCTSCPSAVTAIRRDAAQLASIPVTPLSDQRQAALLRSVVRPPATSPLRLVAFAALLGLVLIGSLIAGAQLVRQPDDDLSVVVPTASATTVPTDDANASQPPISPLPSTETPTAETPAPTEPPAPTLEPTSGPVALAPDSIGKIVTSNLRVRSKPEVSDGSKKLEPLLQDGQQVLIVEGPVAGSGYQWYLVAPIGSKAVGLPFGWVAAADRNGEDWLVAGSIDCPPAPDTFRSFIAVNPLGEPAAVPLTCFKGRDISFPARIIRPEATCGVDPGWEIQPVWLGGICTAPQFLLLDPSGAADEMRDAVVDPGLDTSGFDPGVESATGINVTLTGHWDDGLSRDCHVVITDPESVADPMTDEQAVLTCRSQFVITAMTAANE